jgi:hypothetical protein
MKLFVSGAITRRWRTWPLDGSAELRYVHQKIGSFWGSSKPDYLILVRRIDQEAMALVDGLMSKQTEWCDFLKEQISLGRLHASPEAISMLTRSGSAHPAASTRSGKSLAKSGFQVTRNAPRSCIRTNLAKGSNLLTLVRRK